MEDVLLFFIDGFALGDGLLHLENVKLGTGRELLRIQVGNLKKNEKVTTAFKRLSKKVILLP